MWIHILRIGSVNRDVGDFKHDFRYDLRYDEDEDDEDCDPAPVKG
jgi:hypothetical protein